MNKRGKRAQILIENVMFILLNLIYLTILILFVINRGSGTLALEESYAKQIALLVDSSKPYSVFYLDMEDAIEIAKDKWGEEHIDDIVRRSGNKIIVQLSEDSLYEYSFFNDVNVQINKGENPGFYFTIEEK